MKEWLPAGTQIGRYQIYARISANGIGEVYQATEIASGYELALKLLPAALIDDPIIRERFLQTFSSIARVRHQNLCQVHDAGITEDGRPYVAMEYVKGQSLDLISLNHRLSIPEIKLIVIQFAEAFEALHAQGWIHLSIKPTDLTMSSDLQVKILDLGIGLVIPFSRKAEGSETVKATPSAARYLSPEQLVGERPDQRSDVFSLGAVLYELLTGRPPFSGSSLDEVVTAVTSTTPRSILDFRADMPPAMDTIVSKALAKDPENRYQTMEALASDLRSLPVKDPSFLLGRLGENHDHEAKENPLRGAGNSGDEIEDELAQGSFIDDLKKAFRGLLESKSERSKEKSSKIILERERSLLGDIAYFCRTFKYHMLVSLLALVGIAIAVLVAGFLSDMISDPPTSRRIQTTFLTTNGKSISAAISPDGTRIVYAIEEGDRQTLLLKELKSPKEDRLVSAQSSEFHDLSFSQDGRWISYFKSPAEDVGASSSGSAFRIPTQGGPEQRLEIPNAISAATFSPDGRSLVAIRANDTRDATSLWVGDETGKGVDWITRISPATFHATPPVWSPDGRALVCVTREADSDVFLNLVAVKVEDKSEQTLVSGRFSEINQVIWRADGRGLIIAASDPIARNSQLWRVDYPSGAVSRITRDWSDYRGASMSQDESALISVQREVLSNVWVVPVGDASHPHQVSTGRLDGLNGMAWAPDGRLVYVSVTNNRESILIGGHGNDTVVDETTHRPIPTEGGDGGHYQPTVSPDGQYVAYVVERAGGAYLISARVDQREFIPLSTERLAFFPQYFIDGGSILFSAIRRERGVIARVSSNGGSPETLIDGRGWRAVVAPDGTKLACNYLDGSTSKWRMAVLPISGGAPLAVFDAPGTMHRVIAWTSDGAGLTFIVTRAGVSNIWMQPIIGGSPTQLTDFKTNRIFNFAWSRDGRRLALAQGWISSDVALFQNFR